MIKIKASDFKKLQSGEMSIEQYADVLIAKYTAKEIAEAFVEAITVTDVPAVQPAKITVNEEEYKRITDMFRIAGSSNRGRKKKDA